MTTNIPLELTRPLPADRVGATGLSVTITATATECAAIAKRLMVPSVESLRCEWQLRTAPRGVIEADGSLHAKLHQDCIVTLEPFAVTLVEEFAVRFVPAGDEDEDADDPDNPDELPFDAGSFDLGEATVEQFALALDPYPRKPNAVLPPIDDDTPANPFDKLAKWRKPD
jgi:uncharacterized metal-binding protein YceD (DUF177 family)